MSDTSAVMSFSSILDSLPDNMKLDFETILFVVVLVTCLFIFMKYCCFHPILELVDERDKTIKDGSAQLVEANLTVEQKEIEYKTRLRELRLMASEYHKTLLTKAIDIRHSLLEEAHKEANRELVMATEEFRIMQETAKVELMSKIEDLSIVAMQRIIGRT